MSLAQPGGKGGKYQKKQNEQGQKEVKNKKIIRKTLKEQWKFKKN